MNFNLLFPSMTQTLAQDVNIQARELLGHSRPSANDRRREEARRCKRQAKKRSECAQCTPQNA